MEDTIVLSSEIKTLQVIVFLLGRFFATYAMNVGFQYTVELMPTCLRGQGIAMVNMMSMVSQMASPYIVYSVRDVIMTTITGWYFYYDKVLQFS